MSHPDGTFSARDASMTISTSGDIFQLRNGSTKRLQIIEVRVGQTNLTSLEQLVVFFNRGTGGTTGTALTEYEWNVTGPAATASAASRTASFGTDVDDSGLDLDYGCTWNILQEFVWLPTPDLEIIIPPSVNFGVGLSAPSAAMTTNVNVVWQEL